MRSRWAQGSWLTGVLLALACSAPPLKEMHQAEGAIDAARAAGAPLYAPAAFKDATDSLARAQEAVAQRDYRLALNHALESHQRAQEAAKTAAAERAARRSDAEKELATVEKMLEELTARLESAQGARLPATTLAGMQGAASAAQAALQKAREALARDDYLAAREALSGTAQSLRDAISEIDTAIAQRPARGRRN